MVELQSVWGWQPAVYLFLGGMGAGAFIVAALLFFIDREKHKRIINISLWSSVACLVIGLLFLLSELVNPLRGLLLWQSFSHGTSWMTFGAWVVLAAAVVFAAMAVCTTDKLIAWIASKWKAFSSWQNRLCPILAVAGIVLGVCVAVYTGMLLMFAQGVPLWNTLLLPCLFTVSALGTGVALVEIISVIVEKKEAATQRVRRMLGVSVVILVILESLVLLAFVLTMLSGNVTNAFSLGASAMAATASATILVSGSLAPYFWALVVVCGLAVPLLAAIAGLLMREKHNLGLIVAGATGALIGGCALRFLVIMAGMHADFVADAVVRLIS